MDMAGFTGIIQIDGVWHVVWDGKAYYFDDADKEMIRWHSQAQPTG